MPKEKYLLKQNLTVKKGLSLSDKSATVPLAEIERFELSRRS